MFPIIVLFTAQHIYEKLYAEASQVNVKFSWINASISPEEPIPLIRNGVCLSKKEHQNRSSFQMIYAFCRTSSLTNPNTALDEPFP